MPHMRTSKTHSQLMRPPPVSRSAHRVQAWRIKSGAPLKELNGNQIHVQSQHRGTRNQSLVQKLLRSTDDTNSGERRTANPFPGSSADFRFFPIKLRHWIRRWKGDVKLRWTSNLVMKNSFVSSSQDVVLHVAKVKIHPHLNLFIVVLRILHLLDYGEGYQLEMG